MREKVIAILAFTSLAVGPVLGIEDAQASDFPNPQGCATGVYPAANTPGAGAICVNPDGGNPEFYIGGNANTPDGACGEIWVAGEKQADSDDPPSSGGPGPDDPNECPH